MTNLEKLKKHIKDTGLLGISGNIFVEHTAKRLDAAAGAFVDKTIKPNTTIENYCKSYFPELELEAAATLVLGMITAKGKKVVGECKKCFAFILEGEEHVCSPFDLPSACDRNFMNKLERKEDLA